MKKELLFAIAAGSVLGLIIAFGVWRANTFLKPEAQTTVDSTQTQPVFEEFGITLVKPDNLKVITQSPTTLSGITKANAWVSILGEERDYIIQADSDGRFSYEIELQAGINRMTIVAFDKQGQSATENLLLVYSTEFAKNLQSEDSDSEENNEVASVLVRATAYLGTVTDVAETTLQIRRFSPFNSQNGSSEIKQVATSEDTVFVNVGRTSSEINLTDVAIGDFIIAMGFLNGNQVLEAVRVLVTTEPEAPTNKSFFGEVISFGRNQLTLQVNEEEVIVSTSTATRTTKTSDGEIVSGTLTELSEGDTLVVTSFTDDGVLKARRIHFISSSD